MLTAKHFPGKFDVPYVSGMNNSTFHTGLIDNIFTVNSAYNHDTGGVSANTLGSASQMLICYCPTLSALYGTGSGFATNVKLGGLVMIQCTNPSTPLFSYPDFYSAPISQAYSMADIYGGQGTAIAENAFIWASKMTFTLLGPEATRAGTVQLGHFNVSSIYDK